MRSLVWISAAFALGFTLALGSPSVADAAPKKAKTTKTDAKSSKTSKGKKAKTNVETEPRVKGALSRGAPNQGKLFGSEKLTSNKSLEVRGGGHAYALPELVRALKRGASKVNKKYKGSVLFVGDLSAKNGGPLFGHNSHQSGRDADVGFYMESPQGKHTNPHRFVAFAGDGKARGTELVRFDDERNWTFVEALLSDEKVDVRYLFVSMGLRTRLLKFAAKKNVSKDLYTKAAAALMSPADADVHDDHFHVRIACPERMRGACVEESYLKAGATSAQASSGDTKDSSGDTKEPAAKAEDAKPAETNAAAPNPASTNDTPTN